MSLALGVSPYLRAVAISNGKQTLTFSPPGRAGKKEIRERLSIWNRTLIPATDTVPEVPSLAGKGFRDLMHIASKRSSRPLPSTSTSTRTSTSNYPPLKFSGSPTSSFLGRGNQSAFTAVVPASSLNPLSTRPPGAPPATTALVSGSTSATPPHPGAPPASATATAPAVAVAVADAVAVRGWFSPKKRSKISSSDSSSGRSTPLHEDEDRNRDDDRDGDRDNDRDGLDSGSSSTMSSSDTLNNLSDAPSIPILAAASLWGSKEYGDRVRSPSNISSDESSHLDNTHDSSSQEPLRKRKKSNSSGYEGVTVVEIKVKILADLMEAIIGAFYREGGLQGAVAAMQGLGVWPGLVRQVEGGVAKINGSSNVFGAKDDTIPCPDDISVPVYPVSLPASRGISPGSVQVIPEYPPLYPVRPVRTTSMAAMCGLMEKKLGYLFQDSGLLLLAVTHCSVLGVPSNQRLEFLGDAVLDFVVVKELHRYARVSVCAFTTHCVSVQKKIFIVIEKSSIEIVLSKCRRIILSNDSNK